MTGLLVIMGSGETAPTMVKPHRSIFTRVGEAAAVLLDTPYGFQENADDISARAVAYFAASVGRDVSVVSWRTPPEPGLDRERALAALDEAGWVFAGPGSPTYALRQWVDTPIPEALAQTAQRQGVVVFASAAALTLGSHTVPVYEIYKAGHAACWVPGLDLVRRLTGLPAVVIPHYDNAEGGHHDTRFCYLGERRLSRMEQELPPEAFVLGVDEHTAVLLDLTAGTVSVVGNGVMTIRHGGHSIRHPAGEVIAFEALLGAPGAPAQGGGGQPNAAADQAAPDDGQGKTPAGSLRGETVRLEDEFARAHQGSDVDGCVSALLELEQVLLDWAADTLTSDEGEYARAALRRMVVRLGELASRGVQDPREAVAPYVDALLELRQRARAGRDYATSDWVRDRLTAAGIEVRDTADGVSWAMAEAG